MELYLHPHYAFMEWCSVKAQGQLYLYLLPLGICHRGLFKVYLHGEEPESSQIQERPVCALRVWLHLFPAH
jgi:hypothetical protein